MSPRPTRQHRSFAIAIAALALAGVVAGCGDDGPAPAAAVIDPGDGGDYHPELTASPSGVVDNPYLPLLPGARWVYEGSDGDERIRIETEVLPERRTVLGIEAVVVRDRELVDGELAEDTLDFFVQDVDGNVWYLGEETAEYEGGEVTSTAGSWIAGVDGALPGIVMLARPTVGDAYRQEHLPGEAEDMGEVVAVEGDTVTTRDWTPLEPEVVEEKTYRAGTGLVRAEKVEGGDEVVELVEFRPGSARP